MQRAPAEQPATLDREALAAPVEAVAAGADKAAFAALFRHFAPKIEGDLICFALAVTTAPLKFKEPLGILQRVLNLGRR